MNDSSACGLCHLGRGEARSLFCSRDRFGIKPFHYIERDGRDSIFASEIGLRVSPLYRGRINESQVARGLYLGWMALGGDVLHGYQGTSRIAQLWKNGTLRIWSYAGIDTSTQNTSSFEENSRYS
ncbi:MAG: hypothetical protein IPM83_16965 [Ignavibacteria bacterium]|nr:hypothetical protein [Ignavibacteria bacterium]